MASGRVAIFVDGKNFYEGMRASNLSSKIDFTALAKQIVNAASGSVLTGLHYFTGIEHEDKEEKEENPDSNNENNSDNNNVDEKDKKSSLKNFLSFLETQPGCFVYRFHRRKRKINCSKCGCEHEFTEEKEVDTSLVSIMIRQAAVNAFDYAVLCSGDADHTPALEALRDLGKPAWVATFGGHGLSRRLRQAAYGHIDLTARHSQYVDGADEDPAQFDAVAAVEEAEKYFGEDRYVGLNMFTKEWRTQKLPRSPFERNELIQKAIEAGKLEIYEVDEGYKAIRTVG